MVAFNPCKFCLKCAVVHCRLVGAFVEPLLAIVIQLVVEEHECRVYGHTVTLGLFCVLITLLHPVVCLLAHVFGKHYLCLKEDVLNVLFVVNQHAQLLCLCNVVF